MADLITVPTFIFGQGEIGDDTFEAAINVQYYSNCITLAQEDREVLITYEHFEKLVKEIRKHIPRAQAILSERKS